jgi:hypothetical protein
MTEDEAKTKWCPFARVVMASSKQAFNAGNRVAIMHDSGAIEINENPTHSCCIASACMAWQWAKPPSVRMETLNRINSPGVESREIPVAGDGGCGLAGAPQ